ncbi:LytR C-terminal domain-containing protein [Streptomyces sp. NPDC059881]
MRGSDTPGLAAKVAQWLREAGFTSQEPGMPPQPCRRRGGTRAASS